MNNSFINANEKRSDSRSDFFFSLRTKYVLSILFVVLLSTAILGYFIISRSQRTNSFLLQQFEQSVSNQVEGSLNARVVTEANKISNFFESIDRTLTLVSTTTKTIVSTKRTTDVEETGAWNARDVLFRLPNGSWDNPNNETASIFIPSKEGLSNAEIQELNILKELDNFVISVMDKHPDTLAVYFGSQLGTTIYFPNIDLASLVPADFDVTGRPWYVAAKKQEDPEDVAWSVPYQDAALNGLVITASQPIFDSQQNFQGVLGVDVRMLTITEEISKIRVGETGYAFLIDDQGRVISIPQNGYDDFKLTEAEILAGDIESLSLIKRVPLEIFEVLAKMTSGQSGLMKVNINGIPRYVAYRPIPFVGYSLGIVIHESELQQPYLRTLEQFSTALQSTLSSFVIIIAGVLGLALVGSYLLGNTVTSPLRKLTETAETIAAGNLGVQSDVTSRDEIGALAKTFNSMSVRLSDLVTNLEGEVTQRTRQLERRASQIQAAAEVGNAVASLRDLEGLLSRTTQLISDKFGFYHVGIFLLDEKREFAVLHASNSSGGARMLERGHKLKVGEKGIVGAVTTTGKARIALDVGQDSVYFDNPDLPGTRSELALPLLSGTEILGALDVQSTKPTAFSKEDISTLTILADQIATALQNARFLAQTQNALNAARRAYGVQSREGWKGLMEEGNLGFISRGQGSVIQAQNILPGEAHEALTNGKAKTSDIDKNVLYVPIQVRGNLIGALRLVKPKGSPGWSQQELADISRLAGQLSNSFESARIYREIYKRAAYEQAISDLSARLSSTTEIELIIKETLVHLGETIKDADVALRFTS
jgi:GAF domain-containing protein/HAMP domain-containing protein